MKAIIEFNLPEDEDEFKIYSQSSEMYSALFDLKNKVRAFEKSDYDKKKAYNELREMINQIFYSIEN